MWNKNVGIENTLKMVSGTLNETRNEQKNGLRALTIEMGRVNGNKNVLSDGAFYVGYFDYNSHNFAIIIEFWV